MKAKNRYIFMPFYGSSSQLVKKYSEFASKVKKGNDLKRFLDIIPEHVESDYYGMELKAALDLIMSLDSRVPFDDVFEILKAQNHSPATYAKTLVIVEDFCSRGKEFSTYAVKKLSEKKTKVIDEPIKESTLEEEW